MYVAASVVTCKMTTITLVHALRVNEEGKDLACASTQPIVAKFWSQTTGTHAQPCPLLTTPIIMVDTIK